MFVSASPGPGAGAGLEHSTPVPTHNEKAISIDDPTLASEEKLAIVLGTEGDGLAPQTIENCDYNVIIPMYHNVDSLNVAAASAVAFWQLRAKNLRNANKG